MKIVLFIVAAILSSVQTQGQSISLIGKVKDKLTNENLSFANIKVSGTTSGTAANYEGKFELKLRQGNYQIITSFIGYKSDTLNISLKSDYEIQVFLEPISIRMQEITVLPGINPALEIIRKSIIAKNERDNKLDSYTFKAYTKGLVKTTKDFISSDRSIDITIGGRDTGELKITGIIENESIGYFKKPKQYKDEIIARKQSANTPPTINVLTGGRILQNFYTDDIQFFGRPIPGPISNNAIEYYYYILQDTLLMDYQKVFKIYFEPIDNSDPGFYGNVYIVDSIFALVKIDVNLNSSANPGGLFNKVNIFQQFVPFDDNIYMPIDYRIFVEGNFIGIAKFGFELNSIFYEYQINQSIDENHFGMAVIKILPGADDKDSNYWKSVQSIPNTSAEIEAYKRIDSLESIPKNFWDNFSLLNTTLFINENLSITGPLSLYGFNKVSGHTLNFGTFINNSLNKRLSTSLAFGYGFSDKKLQADFSANYRFGEYRTGSFSFNTFNKLTTLFEEYIEYNKLTSTLTSIIGKYDFRDYYYTKGIEVEISDYILPFFRFGMGYSSRSDNNAINNSDFSLFNKKKIYNPNKPIYESNINTVSVSFNFDFRNYIEDIYSRRRISQGKAFVLISGEAEFSNISILKSSLDYNNYKLKLAGFFPSFKSSTLNCEIEGIHTTGELPYQMMYALPGNIESAGKPFTFRTIRPAEIFGDNGIIINIQHNFNDELFRLLKVPYIKNWQLTLTGYINAAFLQISERSKKIIPVQFTEFKKPLYEIGFGIGHLMLPLTFEFTWRLSHRGKNNFVFGLNSIVL